MSVASVVDGDRVGRRGMPRHYQAFGIAPPMKTVPVDNQGQPETAHPGLTAEEQRELAISAIKVEARRRILLIMTEDQQRNTLAAGQAAVMQFGADPANWPEELQVRQVAAMEAWSEIERLRARSNEIEAMDPLPVDVTADELWIEPAVE